MVSGVVAKRRIWVFLRATYLEFYLKIYARIAKISSLSSKLSRRNEDNHFQKFKAIRELHSADDLKQGEVRLVEVSSVWSLRRSDNSTLAVLLGTTVNFNVPELQSATCMR